jgi:hypothetical protein
MKSISFSLLALQSILLCSCGPAGEGSKSLDYKLQGVWETTKEHIPGQRIQFEDCALYVQQLADCPYSKIEIGYNYITITGNIAHFEGFFKNTPLEAYSEGDVIYIENKNELHPVVYEYWEMGNTYPKDKYLILKASGTIPEETYILTGD